MQKIANTGLFVAVPVGFLGILWMFFSALEQQSLAVVNVDSATVEVGVEPAPVPDEESVLPDPVVAEAALDPAPIRRAAGPIREVYRPDFKYPHLLEQELGGTTVCWVANHLIISIRDPKAIAIIESIVANEFRYTMRRLSENAVVVAWDATSATSFIAENEKWSSLLGDKGVVERDFIVTTMGSASVPN